MAVSSIELPLYQQLHEETRLHLAGSYTQKVVDLLAKKGLLVSNERVSNIMRTSMTVTDWNVLDAVREVLGLPHRRLKNVKSPKKMSDLNLKMRAL